MIDRVIIAEDHEFANFSVQKTMEELEIKHFDYAFYCDDALTKILVAIQKGQPYDLLITDLSFEDDGTFQKITDGYELIRAVREIQPGIMILVLSAEDRPAILNNLFQNHQIDGYVRKARHDAHELKAAFQTLSNHQRYFPRTLSQMIKQSNTYEFTEFDIRIIRLLSQGYQQKEISTYFSEQNIKPSSLSMIEKRLKQMRDELNFSKNEQLVLFCNEAGIL